MDYVFSSTNNNETILVSSNNDGENLDHSNHDEDVDDVRLFGQFPSPFLDDMVLQNHHHPQQQQHNINLISSANQWKTSSSPAAANDEQQSGCKTKRVRKKRSAGKKDRHSKIHTAQGLRDRRMRLSLHIARKFFGLQDILGFDKASKTIEWLFSKSKKAIDEVTEGVKSQNTNQSMENMIDSRCEESPALSDCEVDSGIDLDAAASDYKGKQLKVHDEIIKDSSGSSKKSTTENDDVLAARESRGKARARARERTRERLMMINNLEKSKQQPTFGTNPNQDNFDQLQLGFSNNNHYNTIEESSTSHPLEYSAGTHHFFDHQTHELEQRTQDHLGTAGASSSRTYFSGYHKNFVNPPAGWLNSSNTFLGFLGGWDTDNFTENYGLLPNLAPSTSTATTTVSDIIHGQNFSSLLIPAPSNLLHFQTQNQMD